MKFRVPVLSQMNPPHFHLSYYFKALYITLSFTLQNGLCPSGFFNTILYAFLKSTALICFLLFLQEVCAHQVLIFGAICAYPAYVLRTLRTG